MRIHKLEVKNIASLKGRHHVNFDKIYEDTNLFAITGATGAGKSTLLNCLSLALYGEVYKKGSASQDFVTMGESEGEIALDFSHGQQEYNAQWKLKVKKKNGEDLKKPQLTRILYRIDGSDKIALEESSDQILNLSFAQFCKTSILNQGEFARFLKSSFIERKEILEKFYEGENLSSLNSLLRTKITNHESSMENKEYQVKGIRESISDIKIDEKEIEELSSKTNKAKQRLEFIEIINTKLRDLQKYHQSFFDQTKKLNVLKDKLKYSQDELNQSLDQSKKASQVALKAKNQLEENQDDLTQAINELDKKTIFAKQHSESSKIQEDSAAKLSKVNESLAKDKISMEQLGHDNNELTKNYPLIAKYDPHEIGQFEIQYKNIVNEINRLQEGTESESKSSKILLDKLTKLKDEIKLKEQVLVKIDLTNIDRDVQLTDTKLSQLFALYSKLESGLKNKLNLESQIHTSTARREEFAQKNKDQLAKIKDYNDDLSLAKENQRQFEKLKSINLCIDHSMREKECIVCGNKDISLVLSDLDYTEFRAAELRIEQLNDKLAATTEQLDLDKVKRMSFENEITSLQGQIKQQNSQLLIEWNRLDLPYVDFVLKKESLEILDGHKSQLERAKAKLHSEKDQRQKDFTQLQVLQKEAQQVQLTLTDLEISSKNTNQSLSQKSKEKINLETQLALNSDLNENLLFLKYSLERSIVFKKNTQTIDQLKTNIRNNEATRLQLNEQIADLKQKLTQIKAELEKIDTFLAEKKIDFDPKERLINYQKVAQETENISQQKMKALKTVEIRHTELSSRYKSLEENLLQIDQQFLILKEEIGSTAKNINLNQLDQDVFIKNPLTNLQNIKFKTSDELALITTCVQEFDEMCNRCSGLLKEQTKLLTQQQVLLKQKLEGEEKIKEIEEETNSVKKTLTNLKDLNILIGKDEFRNFVLAKIENILIEQANHELEKLCDGRYRLYQTHKSNRQLSEFKILDHFHGGKERKISTLSGGETFLVSLALALALAEMTRGRTQIDSLFIDEGFGTLDGETVEDVLELLIDIQNSGKQIGIISHVQKLTNRIPVNIHLLKGSDGLSDIEIVMN